MTSDLNQYFHSAFLDAGRVVVGYLQFDYGKLKNTLHLLRGKEKSLNGKSKAHRSGKDMNKPAGQTPGFEH